MPDITKISHGLTIGDFKFGNARPAIVEATLKQGETLEQALDELDERLTAWHKKRYAHLYGDNELKPSDFVPATVVINKDEERLEMDIDNCESVGELHEFKDRIMTASPKLIAYYNQRVKELNGNLRPINFTEGLT